MKTQPLKLQFSVIYKTSTVITPSLCQFLNIFDKIFQHYGKEVEKFLSWSSFSF